MPKKRYSSEQIIAKLREAEVELAKGLKTGAVCRKLADQRADLLPLAPRVRRSPRGPGQASETARAREHPPEEGRG